MCIRDRSKEAVVETGAKIRVPPFIENGQMRFAIGVESARRARLELSSKLLSLAKIIQE